MNEIEKAITYFEALLERLGNGDSDNAVCATALAALREKAGRSKGCEHCLLGLEIAYNAESKHINSKESYICLDGNILEADLYTEYMAAEVRYCPMCGKELEVEHE
jgi:hypothetical protein